MITKGDMVRFRAPENHDRIIMGKVLYVPSNNAEWYIVTNGDSTFKVTRSFIINKIE